MLDIQISPDLRPRAILPKLKDALTIDEVVLLVGSRQSGKTSLMKLLIKDLLKTVNPQQLFYFDLELVQQLEELNRLKDFNQFIQSLKAQGADFNERVWVFLDEIQYLQHPSSFLKYLYDHYKPQLKFIVSGSSTLEIKQKFSDRLTGRVRQFLIHPLSFAEYLDFADKPTLLRDLTESHPSFPDLLTREQHFDSDSIPSGNIDSSTLRKHYSSLRQEFERFTIYGGYPAIAKENSDLEKQRILKELYSLYVRRDIKDIGRIEDVSGFNTMVKLLCFQIGQLVNESELAISSTISRPTVRRYLFLLENTFVIKLLKPFFTNPRKEYVKMPKVYFLDTGLRNGAADNFLPLGQRTDIGSLVENGVLTQLLKSLPEFSEELSFWRSEKGTEVDFIIKIGSERFPVEVKYQTISRPAISSGLRSFIHAYAPRIGVVITRDYWGEQTVSQTRILFLPACVVM